MKCLHLNVFLNACTFTYLRTHTRIFICMDTESQDMIQTEVTTALRYRTFMCEISCILDIWKVSLNFICIYIAFVHFNGLRIPFNKYSCFFSLPFLRALSAQRSVVHFDFGFGFGACFIHFHLITHWLAGCAVLYFIVGGSFFFCSCSTAAYSCWFFLWLGKERTSCGVRAHLRCVKSCT